MVTDSLEVEVTVSGSSERMRVSRCVLHVAGELAGNVDLVVAATPRVQNAARSDLRLDVAGEPEALRAIADGQEEDGLGLTFHAAGLEGVEPPPTSIRLTWGRGGHELGEVRCVVAEAEPEPPEPQRAPVPAPGSGRVPSPIRIRTFGEWTEIESRWEGLTRPLASVLLVAVAILAGPLGATSSDALAPVLAVAVMGFLLCAAIPASLIRYHRSRRMLQQRWTWRLPPLPRVVVGRRELPVLSSHQIVIRREMSGRADRMESGVSLTSAIYLQLSRDECFQLARCRAPAAAEVAALELSELLGVAVRG